MLRIQNLVSHRNGRPVLNGLTLDIPEGQTILLTGENREGKAALLRILSGLEKRSSGTIQFDELATRTEQLQSIAYLCGKGGFPAYFSANSVADLAASLWTTFDADGFRALIEQLDIPQTTSLGKLSATQRKATELACCAARGCRYFLLDSAFSADAPAVHAAMQTVFAAFPALQPTVLIDARYPEDWAPYVDRTIRIDADPLTET